MLLRVHAEGHGGEKLRGGHLTRPVVGAAATHLGAARRVGRRAIGGGRFRPAHGIEGFEGGHQLAAAVHADVEPTVAHRAHPIRKELAAFAQDGKAGGPGGHHLPTVAFARNGHAVVLSAGQVITEQGLEGEWQSDYPGRQTLQDAAAFISFRLHLDVLLRQDKGIAPRRSVRQSFVRSMYLVKEIYYTLQGEGAHTGRPAVFCRFAGCNLWSGREQDRHKAICQFCDTDFVGTNGPGGGKFTAEALARTVRTAFPDTGGTPYVVCTGGEPLLQLDAEMIAAFKAEGLEIAIETNGTIPVPPGIDWVCMSPKAGSETIVKHGDELKLVFPQPGAMPEDFAAYAFTHFYLQPMDGPRAKANTRLAVDYCLQHPQWRLSLQTHKFIGID